MANIKNSKFLNVLHGLKNLHLEARLPSRGNKQKVGTWKRGFQVLFIVVTVTVWYFLTRVLGSLASKWYNYLI